MNTQSSDNQAEVDRILALSETDYANILRLNPEPGVVYSQDELEALQGAYSNELMIEEQFKKLSAKVHPDKHKGVYNTKATQAQQRNISIYLSACTQLIFSTRPDNCKIYTFPW